MLSIPMTFDIVLLLISGAAVLYCRQLNRRLKALHDLKSGVGEAIMQLSAAIKTSNEANEGISAQAHAALKSLDEAVQNVAAERQAAEDILETLDGQVHHAKQRIGQPLVAAERIAEKLTGLTQRSRIEMAALTKAVAITSKVSMLVNNHGEPAPGVVKTTGGDGIVPKYVQSTNPFREKIAQNG